MGERRSPVIAAGLLGAGALVAPVRADALPLLEAVDAALGTPSTGLAIGLAGGVALTAGAAALVTRARRASGPAPAHARAPEGEASRASLHLSVPEDERPEPAAHAAGHAALDYEDIAENYVSRLTFRERMARRAEGVAATLRERMGASKMEGLPVIARADGSVGDVGTSWWTAAVGADTIIRDSGFAPEAAIPSDFSLTDLDRLERAARATRRSDIASRVAFVDEGAYPERRRVEDLDVADEWEAALRSMDERIAAVAPVQDPIDFIDAVGGPDSLDEPDNLEPQTTFIPFKTPGGHPEVVDTDTYVDYLIEDEFSKNSSASARRSSRRFLRILEGGTQPTSSRHLAQPASVPSGKHFARPLAAEA